jgi:hypothetical protein
MLAKLYKQIFDISICYTIGAFLLEFIGGRTIPIRGFLILLLTALVSILLAHKKKWKTLVMILLPIGSLVFLKPSVPELIVFLLIWAYFAYVTITERFVVNRGVFVDMLKRFAYLFLLPAIFMFLDIRHFSSHVQAISPYLASSLVSAVFLLRHLRADNQMEQLKQYRRQQVMELMMFLVICLLLTLIKAPQNLLEGLSLAYQYLLRPILMFLAQGIGMIIMGVIYLAIAIISFLTKKEMHYPDTKAVGAPEDSFGFDTAAGVNVEWIRPFLLSIVTIAALVILFYFFRWLMGEKLRQKLPTGILETRESIEDAKDKETNFWKRRPKDSRAAVRYYYGKYLLWLQHKKVQLRLQDTTEEISKKYIRALLEEDQVKKEASLQIKRLYRKSRYQIAEQITSDEAEIAKQLYQTIKTSKISE